MIEKNTQQLLKAPWPLTFTNTHACLKHKQNVRLQIFQALDYLRQKRYSYGKTMKAKQRLLHLWVMILSPKQLFLIVHLIPVPAWSMGASNNSSSSPWVPVTANLARNHLLPLTWAHTISKFTSHTVLTLCLPPDYLSNLPFLLTHSLHGQSGCYTIPPTLDSSGHLQPLHKCSGFDTAATFNFSQPYLGSSPLLGKPYAVLPFALQYLSGHPSPPQTQQAPMPTSKSQGRSTAPKALPDYSEPSICSSPVETLWPSFSRNVFL